MTRDLRHIRGPLPEAPRVELEEGEVDPFGVEGSGLTFARKDHFVVAFEGGHPIAVAGWLARDIRVGGRSAAAAGLGGVLVRASRRGHGLSRVVVSEAMRTAAAAGRTQGILLCRSPLEPLYAHLGWERIAAEVTFTDSEGKRLRWPLVAMACPLADERWPAGDVDLAGPPF
jgi:predicted N-acetyltransferase YhbS